jgi:LCP family protein required for cell wall assembly
MPTAVGGRRRLAHDPDAPEIPTTGDPRRRRADPDPAFRNADERRRRPEPIGPTAATRRRPADDLDAAAAIAPPAAGTRRRRTEPPADTPAWSARTRPTDTGAPDAPATTALPTNGGTRRRSLDPADLARPGTTSGRRQHPDEPIGATETARRRPSGDPDAPGDDPAGSLGDNRARNARRRPADTGAVPTGDGARRGRLDPGDDPVLPRERRRPAEPTGPSATTALPAATARRRTDDRDAPAGTAPPTAGTRRRRAEPPADTPARSTRTRPAGTDAPATTALPTSSGHRRRHLDPDDDLAVPATAAGERRRPAEPTGPSATTVLPAAAVGRRRTGGDPSASASTALPADGSRRRRPDAEPSAATALPGGPRNRPDVKNQDATAVMPAARRSSSPPDAAVDGPAATTRVRSLPPDREGAGRSRSGERPDPDDDARTRAMRIDETLTRLTAAHAGVTLAVTDRPAEDEKTSTSRPRRGVAATAGRLLAGALALVVLGAAAFGWGTKTWLGSAVRDAAALDPGSSAIVDAAVQSGDENVLVVATEPGAGEAQPRADTVAVAHLPDGGGPVTVLAFPLDLEIDRPPCERWDAGASTYSDEPVQAEAGTQLVSALDLGGPRCITRVVQQLSGLAITKYVGIDLGAVPALTDAVGGAEVCVPRPVLDRVLGPVVPDPGPNRLAGVRAADFVHAGDVEGEPSAEFGRIERQQQVLAAVLDSAVAGTALLDVGRLGALRPTLADAVLTDGAGIGQVLALAMTLRRLDADGVQAVAVPTGEQNGRGNAVLRDTDAAALFAAVRGDEPLPAAATEPGGGTTGPAPSEVTVEVVNASARSGLAGDVGETLRSLGFDVGEIASAEEPTSQTVIRFSPDQAAAAEVLAATVPSATSVPDPGTTGVLQLVLGRSFDDVVRAPTEPIALAAPTSQEPAEPGVTCA